ncbi:MAG: glycosyltransferase [Melioribacteraceae bacterium]
MDEIIVVNNSSTDGTFEWLTQQNDLTIITQKNLGGAGGFHTGIKNAFEKRYDWIWCMDDDCLLTPSSLKNLFREIKENIYVYGCLVISKENTTDLACGYYEKNVYIEKVSEVKLIGRITDVNFFLGTLIHSSVIKKVGLPYSDMVIRGDEVEYNRRIRLNKFQMLTINDSILYHPKSSIQMMELLGIRHRFEVMNSFKRYYHNRNFVYLMKQYRYMSLKVFLKHLLFDLYGIIFYQRSFNNLYAALKGLIAGIFYSPTKIPNRDNIK